MSSNNDGGPAFPQPMSEAALQQGSPWEYGADGMSLRDWFAGQFAAQLIQAHSKQNAVDGLYAADLADFDGDEYDFDKWVSIRSYEIADAMLAARNAGKEQE